MDQHILCSNWNIANKLKYLPPKYFLARAWGVGWTISGIANKDKAIMTNFGLQIPLFAIGYINLFF